MARATLTTYECEHDLVPMVCARCGAPASERVPRRVPVPPGCGTAAWFFPLFLLVYLAVPAVVALLPWLTARRYLWTEVHVPLCAADRGHWAWRERVRLRFLWPATFVAALAVQIACLAGLILQPAFYAHSSAAVVILGFVIDGPVLSRGEVTVHRAGKEGFSLNRVHPDFVEALIEDRARDRVDNPDRRVLGGDVHDDFDDEPV